MARKYEIGVAADTDGFEKSIVNGIVDPLEDAADAFDDLEKAAKSADLDREIEKGQKATQELEDELDDTRSALKRLGFAAKDAGDSTRQGMDRAEEGVEELGNEAQSTAKEAAASFDGSAESIIDAFQEVAANAFAGFGPAGALAGLALAAGIGIAVGEFQKAEEAAEELRQKALEIATAAQDAGVSTDAWASGAERMVERIRELEELKSTDWRWFWEDDPSQLEEWTTALKQMGRPAAEVSDVLGSSTEAVEDYRAALKKSQDALYDEIQLRRQTADITNEAETAKTEALVREYEAHGDVLKYLDEEITLRGDAAESAERQSQVGIDAAMRMVEAEEARAEAMNSVQESVTNAYDSLRDKAVEYATAENGALDINRWLEYTQEHAAAVATYQANIERIRLSPAQWQNLLEMPEDQRMQWVSQFAALPESARAPFAAALNDVGSSGGDEAAVAFDQSFDPDADVTVDVDTSGASKDLTNLATKKRTAEIKVKTTGKADAKRDLDALARKRVVTIQARLDTSRATRDMYAWRRWQESRPITITANVKAGRRQLV